MAAECTQGKRTQPGKPHHVLRDEQPDAREGWDGRSGVAEGPVVPGEPGNAGGGKGPQFKANAKRGKGQGIGKPSNPEKRPLCRPSVPLLLKPRVQQDRHSVVHRTDRLIVVGHHPRIKRTPCSSLTHHMPAQAKSGCPSPRTRTASRVFLTHRFGEAGH